MRKSQFIFVLMLGSSFATMVRADDTSLANCEAAAGEGNCHVILNNPDWPTEGYLETTYYALSGPEGNQTMTIYGTSGSTAAIVPNEAFIEGETWESTFPGGITSLKTSGNVDIGGLAFYDATGLTSIDLTGVQTIGSYAFSGATGLTGHLDLTGVQTIGDFAFADATGLTSVDLTGVQSIGGFAFAGATGLTSIDLTGVQTIDDVAFAGATGLTSVVISDSLLDSNGNITGINNYYAFEDCGLNTIYCPTDRTCGNSFWGVNPRIISYSIDENGQIKAGGKTYASFNDLASGKHIVKRIYTVEEATAISGPKNRFRIRYK